MAGQVLLDRMFSKSLGRRIVLSALHKFLGFPVTPTVFSYLLCYYLLVHTGLCVDLCATILSLEIVYGTLYRVFENVELLFTVTLSTFDPLVRFH